jgi:hypothetical protein
MQNDRINTIVLSQLVNQIKAAELGQQKEIRIDIATAKNIRDTLALVMIRLAGNYEGLLQENRAPSSEDVTIRMDGGSWDQK